MKALIRIGPDGAAAVAHAAWEHMGYEDRLASLIVVSRVGEGTEAREFILRALGEANLQRDWAEETLKVVAERGQH